MAMSKKAVVRRLALELDRWPVDVGEAVGDWWGWKWHDDKAAGFVLAPSENGDCITEREWENMRRQVLRIQENHMDCADSAADPVNHPAHYQSEDGIECIDAIRAALGLEGFVAHCRGTAIKYAWRSGKKQRHAEDLRKAAWYLTKAAEELER